MRPQRLIPILFGGLAASAALVTLPAHAVVNIVTNGGFETGDLTGWTGSAASDPLNGVACEGTAPEGICAAFLGAFGADESLQQALATQAGTQYQISFAISAAGDSPSDLSLQWGNQTLYSVTNPNTGGAYTTLTFLALASGTSTTLSFNARDDVNAIRIDAVSVTAVPEPGRLALMAVGLGCLWLGRKRAAH